jgi:hypothetical protein
MNRPAVMTTAWVRSDFDLPDRGHRATLRLLVNRGIGRPFEESVARPRRRKSESDAPSGDKVRTPQGHAGREPARCQDHGAKPSFQRRSS